MRLDPGRPVVALVVAHDEETRQSCSAYLKRAGLEIDEAADGREALAKALSSSYDVVVTETALPGIRGSELCELLRLDPTTRHLRLVVVTADVASAEADRMRHIADVVLKQPCRPDVILTEIRKLLDRSRSLRRNAEEVRPAKLMGPVEPPPSLVCPACYEPLVYRHSHVGGVARKTEQWDYFDCSQGCGAFQYRQRTRRLKKVS